MQLYLEALDGIKENENGWVRIGTPAGASECLLDEAICKLASAKTNPALFCLMRVSEFDLPQDPSPIGKRWLEICETSIVPFEIGARKRAKKKIAQKIQKLLEIRREAKKSIEKARRENDGE